MAAGIYDTARVTSSSVMGACRVCSARFAARQGSLLSCFPIQLVSRDNAGPLEAIRPELDVRVACEWGPCGRKTAIFGDPRTARADGCGVRGRVSPSRRDASSGPFDTATHSGLRLRNGARSLHMMPRRRLQWVLPPSRRTNPTSADDPIPTGSGPLPVAGPV